MTIAEKSYSIFAVIFAFALISIFVVYPETRTLKLLLPLSFAGLLVNIGLMFVVLRDIFLRNFQGNSTKYIWIAVILVFWPAVLYYLPKYGFKGRES